MADIKVAVMGMAHDHLWTNLRQLKDVKGAALVGGADPVASLQAEFKEKTGCSKVYGDYEELLDKEKPDAVFAFTATAHHVDVVELCAPRGIHVMVEKPMAATLEQADRMLVAARKANTRLMVNWPTAWSRCFHTLKRLIDEGTIGQVWQLLWRGGHSGPDELGCSEAFCGFLFDKDLNGAGAFNDYGGYGSSMCVQILGTPQQVVGMAGRLIKTHLPVDDNGMMLIRYPHAICRLEMSWTEAVPHKPPHDILVYGTEGTAVAGREGVELYTRDDKEGKTISPDELQAGRTNGPEYFVNCIQNDEDSEGMTSPDASRAAQEIMEAGLISATSGMAVSLPIEDHLFRG